MSTDLTTINDAFQRNKEHLVDDLKRIVGDADDLVKHMANSTSAEFTTSRRKIEAKLAEARTRINEARTALARTACHAADATNEYIRENPWKVVGIASLAGLVTALLLYRRNGR